jgi:uncharacterized protein GlcG (DUF336 family)
MALTWVDARNLIDAAFAAARRHGFRPMAVVVVDAAAQVVASGREDGASALRLDIALGKAAAAAGMSVSSRVLGQRAKDLPVFFGAVAAMSVRGHQPFVPHTGAVLIRSAAGDVLGAAGASGGTGDEDEEVVISGIRAAGLICSEAQKENT